MESIKLDEYITGTAQPKLNQKMLNLIPFSKTSDVQVKIVENIESLSTETLAVCSMKEITVPCINFLDFIKRSGEIFR